MEQNGPSLRKKIAFSGIQPTGLITLGNYLGALRQWVNMQEEFHCVYSIVDLHALTVRQDPKAFRQSILESYALLLACGVDPEASIAFIQSQVKTHAEFAWIMSCFTQFGELSRMTQFKDKSAAHADNVNAGLFTYPALMAADILLYQTDVVPVGADQKQHVELTRDIAGRFNNLFGRVFRVPEPYIPKEGARIMSLQDPSRKMSKSDPNPKSFVGILDSKDAIIKKFRAAVTDSEAVVAYGSGKDGINNLMTIYSVITGRSMEDIRREFEGRGYGDFKTAVGEAVADHLRPIRERHEKLLSEKDYLQSCYTKGAEKALSISQRTLDKAYDKLGLLRLA